MLATLDTTVPQRHDTAVAAPTSAHRPRRSRRPTALAVAILTAVAAVVVTAAPASAASTAQCNTTHTWSLHDGNGDPYGGSPPFDYTITTPAYRNSAGSYTWRCWMAKGSTGPEVKRLQQTINHCYGYYWTSIPGALLLGLQLAEDGIYGSKTAAALTRIQDYLGINADGVYGPESASHLRHQGNELNGQFPGPLCHTIGG